MNNDLRKCPYCAETIRKAALVCRYCGEKQLSAEPVQPTVHNPTALNQQAGSDRPVQSVPKVSQNKRSKRTLTITVVIAVLLALLGGGFSLPTNMQAGKKWIALPLKSEAI